MGGCYGFGFIRAGSARDGDIVIALVRIIAGNIQLKAEGARCSRGVQHIEGGRGACAYGKGGGGDGVNCNVIWVGTGNVCDVQHPITRIFDSVGQRHLIADVFVVLGIGALISNGTALRLLHVNLWGRGAGAGDGDVVIERVHTIADDIQLEAEGPRRSGGVEDIEGGCGAGGHCKGGGGDRANRDVVWGGTANVGDVQILTARIFNGIGQCHLIASAFVALGIGAVIGNGTAARSLQIDLRFWDPVAGDGDIVIGLVTVAGDIQLEAEGPRRSGGVEDIECGRGAGGTVKAVVGMESTVTLVSAVLVMPVTASSPLPGL